MRIIVDTNIVFSAILNSNSKIGKLLINCSNIFEFYSCEYLLTELNNHQLKLIKYTKLTSENLSELIKLVTQNITFINEKIIPLTYFIDAEKLVNDIDPNDIAFIALAQNLNAKLWTGDKQLIDGLKIKKFKNIITTPELLVIFEDLQK